MQKSSCIGFKQKSDASSRSTPASLDLRAHVRVCAHCAGTVPLFDDEVAAWTRGGVSTADQVAVRRIRERLLRDLATSVPARRGRELLKARAPRGLVGALLGVVAFLFASRLSTEEPAEYLAKVSPRDGQTATWSRSIDGGLERLKLVEGEVEIRVRSHRAGQSLIVEVPDGYLEDRGTTFEVVVRSGRTERIAVVEGRVAYNLLGLPERILTAGERWERPGEVPVSEPTGISRAAVPSPSELPRVVGDSAQVARAAIDRRPRKSTTSESPEAHPEDVAYLRVIRLLRDSRRAEAALAARRYLHRFPGGFRAEEMRVLIQRTAPQ